MKLRNFYIVLSLLTVLCVCLSLTAQVNKTVDTSPKSPLEKAKEDFDEASHVYDLAKDAADEAYEKYDRSDSAYGYLNTAYSISKPKDEGKLKNLRGSIKAFLDAAGMDPLDVVTDLAGFVFTKVEDNVWDTVEEFVENKPDIQRALWKEYYNLQDLQKVWQDAKTKKNEALAKKDAAHDKWQELKPIKYTFGNRANIDTVWPNESVTSFLDINKRWKHVKWWVKGPSDSGKGTLVSSAGSNSSQSKVSEMTYTYSEEGDYVISVYAEMESTSEVVDASYTLKVLDTGITYNKKSFIYGEKLVVTIVRTDLVSGWMRINGDYKTGGMANSEGKVILTYDVSKLFIMEEQKYVYGEVIIGVQASTAPRPNLGTSSTHTDYISVVKPAYNSSQVTEPDKPNDVTLSESHLRNVLVLKWKEPDSNGGAKVTDYEYQYRHWKDGSGWQLPSGWESAGKDMGKVISGLKSGTKYCVRMRAKNEADKYSDSTNWSNTVRTR